MIERELAKHDPRLAGLPRMLALWKADLVAPVVRGGGRRGVARAPGGGRPGDRDVERDAQGLDELRPRAAAARAG